jgi:hypothetical protein
MKIGETLDRDPRQSSLANNGQGLSFGPSWKLLYATASMGMP